MLEHHSKTQNSVPGPDPAPCPRKGRSYDWSTGGKVWRWGIAGGHQPTPSTGVPSLDSYSFSIIQLFYNFLNNIWMLQKGFPVYFLQIAGDWTTSSALTKPHEGPPVTWMGPRWGRVQCSGQGTVMGLLVDPQFSTVYEDGDVVRSDKCCPDINICSILRNILRSSSFTFYNKMCPQHVTLQSSSSHLQNQNKTDTRNTLCCVISIHTERWRYEGIRLILTHFVGH